ncbi:hypothetical protein ACWDRB_04875 [Nonomuraea sp. NPDC003707]
MLPEITPSSFAGLTQQLTDAARRHQLSVNVATSNGDVEVDREHVAELARRRVSGVILLSVGSFQDSSWAAAVGVQEQGFTLARRESCGHAGIDGLMVPL